jgi:hypothetical protein
MVAAQQQARYLVAGTPVSRSRATASGTSATRRSPGVVSWTTPTVVMVMVLECEDEACGHAAGEDVVDAGVDVFELA